MYLLDTDTIIYCLKNVLTTVKQFRVHANDPKVISVITYGELYYGAWKSKYREKNLAQLQRIAELFQIIEISKGVTETFGFLRASLELQGNKVADLDLLIGSTALVMNYTLVTNNKKHFSKIPGLKLANWFD